LGEFNKATLLVVGRHCDLIFCLLINKKCFSDKVEKDMIQVFECHFLGFNGFFTNRKCDFYHVNKATIQVVELHLKVIFCLLTSTKFNLSEFEKSIIQVVTRHFFLLTSPKCDLGEVEKAMFQGLAYHFELIFGLLTIQICDFVEKTTFQGLACITAATYFRPVRQPKCGFDEFKKATFLVVPGHCELIFSLINHPKMRYG